MEILMVSYNGEAQDTAVLLRRTVRGRGRIPIAFACVIKGLAADRERELMDTWFRERALPFCERCRPEEAVDAVQKAFIADRTCRAQDMAVLFCMGGECFYARQGGMGVSAVNLCFDRTHLKKLAFPSDRPESGRAALEQGVGILLGDESFFAHLTEAQLKECLKTGEIRGQEQAERRLTEAAEAARRQGAASPAAAFLLIRGNVSAEALELLRRNGYENPQAVGRGAFGRVYQVRDVKTGKRYACKVAENMDSRVLLRREVAMQQSIRHPLFARYKAVLEGDFCTLFLMEYVRGQDLSTVLSGKKLKKLSEKQAVRIAIQLAEGLRYLHTLPNPVLYRDLKPENVRITMSGKVKLLDLGCACRLSEAGFTRAGSRGYAAPEQLGRIGVPPGFYSDVYALGRLLERMTEGVKISAGLNLVISKCISENPSERFQDMDSLLFEFIRINSRGGNKFG